MNIECIRCKGRNFCDRPNCLLMIKMNSQKKFNENAKEDFFGKSPNVFVGKHGYPNVNIGLLSTEKYNHNDEVPYWVEKKLDIDSIINLRIDLINSNFNTNVKNFNSKFLDIAKEISLSKNPADVEINLNKKPQFNVNFFQDLTPFGPSVKIKKAKLTENTKIPKKVEYIVNDELKAEEAIEILNKQGINEHYLTKIFSVGNLGLKKNKKLVPTRWSITAIDDTLSKKYIEKIKYFSEHEYSLFFGGYLGNYYIIFLFPDIFRYELFETYAPKNSPAFGFTTDYEDFKGRKQYAHETAGGYYAAKLAVLEYLKEKKKKASVLCLRFITEEYTAPLGVWIVREASRNSMKRKVMSFGEKEKMIEFAKGLVKEKFNYNLEKILKNSKLLIELKQPKLKDFF